eukprot:NODE_167_length_1746_cov_174.352387_g115_i0.p8 GENE.NODE_167_length_1746_cov_174.352387_g115_i0~~NODE_167_length_1746_cov_174.352387_g115_i0.p8  ORF type:complete len:58 (+),score=7.42 NODE_167_length_1746_cov_174.352387_g115_i0:1384-1557(+)
MATYWVFQDRKAVFSFVVSSLRVEGGDDVWKEACVCRPSCQATESCRASTEGKNGNA